MGPILKYNSYLAVLKEEYDDFQSTLFLKQHDILKSLYEELAIFILRIISKLTYEHDKDGKPKKDGT